MMSLIPVRHFEESNFTFCTAGVFDSTTMKKRSDRTVDPARLRYAKPAIALLGTLAWCSPVHSPTRILTKLPSSSTFRSELKVCGHAVQAYDPARTMRRSKPIHLGILSACTATTMNLSWPERCILAYASPHAGRGCCYGSWTTRLRIARRYLGERSSFESV